MKPVQDKQIVTSEGQSIIDDLIDGIKMQSSVVHMDNRGSLCEIHNKRWDYNPALIEHVYYVTTRSGKIRGWVHHKTYADRLMVIRGDCLAVFYDFRADSPTSGKVNEIYLSGNSPTLITIPAHVYHALQNVGQEDMTFINMPTKSYDYKKPDKHRLPLDNDVIPYTFQWRVGQ